jgi:hypothetical protein
MIPQYVLFYHFNGSQKKCLSDLFFYNTYKKKLDLLYSYEKIQMVNI